MLTIAMGRLLLVMDMDMLQLPMADMLLSATDMSLLAMDMDMLQLPMADMSLSTMDMLLPERSICGYATPNLSSSTMSWI